jgi:hypothetical protein
MSGLSFKEVASKTNILEGAQTKKTPHNNSGKSHYQTKQANKIITNPLFKSVKDCDNQS